MAVVFHAHPTSGSVWILIVRPQDIHSQFFWLNSAANLRASLAISQSSTNCFRLQNLCSIFWAQLAFSLKASSALAGLRPSCVLVKLRWLGDSPFHLDSKVIGLTWSLLARPCNDRWANIAFRDLVEYRSCRLRVTIRNIQNHVLPHPSQTTEHQDCHF